MVWITRKRQCHSCGSRELTRYHRSFWMRFFKGSQRLRCRQCRATILLLRGGEEAPVDEPSGSGP